ncbi:MAG TPA: hypothetical protein VM513_02960 [Kofleriaceae bacterium]|jgi:uncharacterized protein YecE (DUF72 family)|nr:hypothetical protein [Kofleriaceae bacterium]
MAEARIGTVDIPERMDRARYFRELDFLELSALFAGPLKPSVLAGWAEVAPRGSLALVAPFVLTHRKPPKAAKLWTHDATTGDFRDSAPGRVALAELRKAVDQLGASHVVFKSPSLFAASQANRDQLARFFGEVATEEAVGAPRVWIPDGLWDLRTAITFANELGVVCAFDPLVRDPGQPPEVHYDLDVSALYLRIAGLGRTGPLRSERQDDLLMLLEHYEDVPATIAFESPERWKDARNLKKSLEAAV